MGMLFGGWAKEAEEDRLYNEKHGITPTPIVPGPPERYTPEDVEGKPVIGRRDIIIIGDKSKGECYYVKEITEDFKPIISLISDKRSANTTPFLYEGVYNKVRNANGRDMDKIKIID